MTADAFSSLPHEARLLVFSASRPLTPGEIERLLAEVDGFISGWSSHREAVTAARDWRHDRFLLVAADENVTALSGCSVDKITRRMKELGEELKARLVDNEGIYFRSAAGIERVGRAEFAGLVESGAVNEETIVFNNTVTRLGDLRAGQWELPFRNSWHARAFPRSTSPAPR